MADFKPGSTQEQAAQVSALTPPVSTIPLEKGKPAPFHCDYFKQKRARDFFRASYTGGAKYKKANDADGKKVLEIHPQESKQSYERRLRLAVYRNYCKPIVTKYNDFVFIQPIKRDDKNTRFKEWAEDVDLLGSALHEFMRDHIRSAQVSGSEYCLIESTKNEDKTTAQATQEKDKLFLIDIDADRIINWVEDSGILVEALIYFPNKNEVRLYDFENITIATVKKGGTEIENIEAPMPHGYGMLPVIRFTALDDGSSQIEDIAECNKSLFNMDALLREELHNQTFTQWIVSGIGPDEMQAAETTLAGRKLWCINKSEIKVERIGSDVSQAESIRATIDGDIKEIYRLSGLHNPDVIQKAESGRALHIRWNDVEITAAAVADHSEEVENRIIDLWIAGMGGNEVVEYSDYPETFDSEDLGIALKATLDTLMSDMPFVLKKEQIKEYAGKAFPKIIGDISEELDTELEDMGKQNEENRNNIAAMNAANNDNPEMQPIEKGATE